MSLELWLNVVDTAILVMTAVFVCWQVKEARRATDVQSMRDAFMFLQSRDIRDARKTVRGLKGMLYCFWTDSDKDAAGTVCSSYNLVATMVADGLFPGNLFKVEWGPSIKDCVSICSEFIDDRRKSNGSSYWGRLTDLYEDLKKSN